MTADPAAAADPATPAAPQLITVSAAYGAGGSVVAPALADRLGLPFLQRVTTSEGHLAKPGPCDEQLSADEVKHTPVHRLLASRRMNIRKAFTFDQHFRTAGFEILR